MQSYKRDLTKAVKWFWTTREGQMQRQLCTGISDAGSRGCVTGGKQMAAFEELFARLLVRAGVGPECIFCVQRRQLPGYFRAEKNWDLVVVHESRLLAALEFKSHVGSFGNNANNRVEEAIGNAKDLLTAYREGLFSPSPKPWMGYLMLLEDSSKSRNPVGVCEPHFRVDKEFKGVSYQRRYELFMLRLVREQLYDRACFIISDKNSGVKGKYIEPNPEIGFTSMVESLLAHIQGQMRAHHVDS